MADQFPKPKLPRPDRLLGRSEAAGKGQEQPKEILERYRKAGKRRSMLMGLSDATGSMAGIWSTTRAQIGKMIERVSELGDFSMNWVAYRDYGDGPRILEPSGWQTDARALTRFLNGIECIGGEDWEEAVERALEYAAKDQQATRVVLIGDAPPHPDRDFREQASRLGGMNRKVFCFVVGGSADTRAAFGEIARLSGGLCTDLTSERDLLDFVALTMVDDMGGGTSVDSFLEKHAKQLSPGTIAFAKALQAPKA